MTWLAFSLLSLFLTVTYGLISKKILNQEETMHPVALASAMFIFVGLISLIIYLIGGVSALDVQSLRDRSVTLPLAFNLILYTLAPSAYYRALKKLPLSLVIIIYSLSSFFTLVIEVLLKVGSFNFIRLLGSFLVISAVVLVSFNRKESKLRRAVPLLLIAVILYSAAAVFDNQLLPHFSDSLYLALTFGIPGLLVIPFNCIPLKKIREPYQKGNYTGVIFYAIAAALSFFFVFRAYRSGGSASQVYSVLALESVVTVIASAIFLKEGQNLLRKLISALIAGIGVYLVTI